MSVPSPSCRESRDAAAVGPADATQAVRIERHRASCVGCATYQSRIAAARRAIIDAAGPGLDDLQRARMGARLAAAVDELSSRRAQRRPPATASLMAAAFALGLAAGLLLFWRVRSVPSPVAPLPVARSPLAPSVGAPSPVAPSLALLQPYVLAGEAAREDGARRALARSVERLEVPAGGLVRATLGARARVTLVGPATLSVRQVARDTIDLELVAGLLLGEYDHARGGTLRVTSPGAVTSVVGTVFAIDAGGGDGSRVSVSNGRVEVRAGARTLRVDAGWSYRTGAAEREPIPLDIAALLADQALAIAPPSDRPAELSLQGTPARADVRLNGAPLGPTPILAALAPGAIRLSVSAAHHLPVVLPAILPDAGSLALHYTLPPSADDRSPRTRPAAQMIRDGRLPADRHPVANEAAPPDALPPGAASRPHVETADEVYARAEAAMRAGDQATARVQLTDVARRFPSHPLADAALYELGRLSAVEAPTRAAAYLDELLARKGDPTLQGPARFLRCRLDVDARRAPAAAACLDAFRRDFPSSSHDAEALALLIGIAQSRHDCPRARAQIDEYLRRYPTGPFAGQAAERRSQCAP